MNTLIQIPLIMSIAGGIIILLLILILRRQLGSDKQLQALTFQLTAAVESLDKVRNDSHQQQQKLQELLLKQQSDSKELHNKTKEQLLKQIHEGQLSGMQHLQTQLNKAMEDVRKQIVTTLSTNAELIEKRMQQLSQNTDQRLKDISGQVDKRLSEGFEKTTKTFTDIIQRLAMIDEAQKKINELSVNVVSLQEVLVDKRSRGAFGEVQLSALIRNIMPENNVAFQHTFSNGKRADCVLFLPEPTGTVAIDAKFPLENYRILSKSGVSEADKLAAEQRFRQDIKRHIQDIKSKYIIPGETSDGALMFIPAESIFADIHAHFPDLVEESYKARVWLVSPTTMMAILTTARAVLKDAATRQQVNIIQEHLRFLGKDFSRFQKRMDSLAKHINQANEDVTDVNTSAKKIVSRFSKIEQVELQEEGVDALESIEET